MLNGCRRFSRGSIFPERKLPKRQRVILTHLGILMARETIYVVQAFKAGRGQSLRADAAISCKSVEGARRTAERLAATSVGVVAFSSTGDAESGDYDDEPAVFFRSGRLPDVFA